MRVPDTPTDRVPRERYGDSLRGLSAGHSAKAQAWDPDGWAASSAIPVGHYVVLTANCDGYCLWPTKHENRFIKGWSTRAGRGRRPRPRGPRAGMRSASISRAALDWSWHKGPRGRSASTSRACRAVNFPPIRRTVPRALIAAASPTSSGTTSPGADEAGRGFRF